MRWDSKFTPSSHFYDLFACGRREGSEFLIRATQNRCLAIGEKHLWEAVESLESQGTMTVEVKRNPTRPARSATLSIRYTTVTIQPPQNRPKQEQLAPISLQAMKRDRRRATIGG